MHHPAVLKVIEPTGENGFKHKNPCLVFGPDLALNLKGLNEKQEYLQEKCLPKNILDNNSSNATNFDNGIKYFNISTENISRNVSSSGICSSKPVVSWIRESLKNYDINDNLVDRNYFVVVGKKVDLYPLALVIARAFPMYTVKTKGLNDSRNIFVQFISTDDNNACDKSSLQNLIDNVRNAARLVDVPCNLMNTVVFEQEARQVVSDLNDPRVTIEVFQEDELKERGMGLIYSVGQSSPEGQRSRMAILKLQNGDNLKNVAWVGKGIVYDTGGLSLKTPTFMAGMKKDCGGAAGLLFAFKQAVQNGFNQNLYCILCLAENSVGPLATRPDDIITAYSGQTIEINNTDAEGRLVLGDGVHYATKDLKADICLNMCTLTGAQKIIAGQQHAAVMSNRYEYEAKLVQAGKESGDHCFPMLYAPDLLIKEFESPCADLKNSVNSRVNAPSSCAGHFIESHLLGGSKYSGAWIHIDMSACCRSIYDVERHNGYGVSLMQKLFREYFDESKNCF